MFGKHNVMTYHLLQLLSPPFPLITAHLACFSFLPSPTVYLHLLLNRLITCYYSSLSLYIRPMSLLSPSVLPPVQWECRRRGCWHRLTVRRLRSSSQVNMPTINRVRFVVFLINSSLLCFVFCVITDQLIGIHLWKSLEIYSEQLTEELNAGASIWPTLKHILLNPLKTKRRLLYLKIQSVPRCKHFSSRL